MSERCRTPCTMDEARDTHPCAAGSVGGNDERDRYTMKTMFLLIPVLILVEGSPAQMRISQIYGGGGNSGSPFTHDFIELLNAGTVPIDLSGWSVRYASATGATWQMTALTGTVQPMHYVLIQEALGSGGASALPAPDITGSIAMSATAGKVLLMSSQAALTGSCPAGADIVDLVGFGPTASCFEGDSTAPAPGSKQAVLRKGNGKEDSNDNGADFFLASPDPRNSGSAPVYVRHTEPGDLRAFGEPVLSSYPNPFNAFTRLVLTLSRSAHVSLTLVNLLGETVRELLRGRCEEGMTQILLDGADLPSGIYLCLLRTEGSISTHRLVLLR